jgi:ribosomal protein L12E/L44/L45/RPP1/RPP2
VFVVRLWLRCLLLSLLLAWTWPNQLFESCSLVGYVRLMLLLHAAALPAGMDVDEPAKPAAASDAATAAGDSSSGAKEGDAAAAGDGKAEGAAATDKDKEKEKEPSSFNVTAPCRAVPHQVKHMALPAGGLVVCLFEW